MRSDVKSMLNGMPVIERRTDTVFLRLPRELWRECGRCDCPVCQGKIGYWDTLAVSTVPPYNIHNDHSWVVHLPSKSSGVADFVIEFHYKDGDVGAHPEDSVVAHTLWEQFAADGHEADYIVIRRRKPDEE